MVGKLVVGGARSGGKSVIRDLAHYLFKCLHQLGEVGGLDNIIISATFFGGLHVPFRI